MKYISKKDSKDGEAKVIYTSKDGKKTEIIPALEFLARLITHIPNKGEQLVRYYGYYANRSRGERKKENREEKIKPTVKIESDSKKKFKRNWARLIQKIYEVNPLKCPKCCGQMKVVGFVEDEATIKKVLQKLNLWNVRNTDPPDKNTPQNEEEPIIEYCSITDFEYIKYPTDNDNEGNESGQIEFLQMSGVVDILPNYEYEIDQLPNYEEEQTELKHKFKIKVYQ